MFYRLPVSAILTFKSNATDVFVRWATMWWRYASASGATENHARILAARIVLAYHFEVKRFPTIVEWVEDFQTAVPWHDLPVDIVTRRLRALVQKRNLPMERSLQMLRPWSLWYALARENQTVALQHFSIDVGTVFLKSIGVLNPDELLIPTTDWTQGVSINEVFWQALHTPQESWRAWAARMWREFVAEFA